MAAVDLVIVVHETDSERQGVVTATALALQLVLVVTDISAVAVPTDARAYVSLLLGVKQRFEALIEGAVWLDEVDDVELVADAAFGVGHPEVVPLRVRCRVIIVTQVQIVFVVGDFLGTAEVGGFEARLEYQGCVIFRFLRVVRLELAVVTVDAHFVVTAAVLTRWSIGIELSLVDGSFVLLDLDSIVLVNVRSLWHAFLPFGRRPFNAVVDYAFVGPDLVVDASFGVKASVVLDDSWRDVLADWLVGVTGVFETRPVHKERILDTRFGQLQWPWACFGRFFLPSKTLLLRL